MKHVQVSIAIERPAAEVFDYLEDVTNNNTWLNVRSCTWTTDPPVRSGSRYDQVAEFRGKEIRTSYEVTAHEPGRLVTVSSREGSPFPLTATSVVEPAGDRRCRVTQTVQSDARGFYKMVQPLWRTIVTRNLKREYGVLKGLLEARTAPA